MKKTQSICFLFYFVLFDVSASVIRLEETNIGLAVINENIEDYRKAWNKLKPLPSAEVFKILTATDYRGNNLLHMMARVRRSREVFAGEMLQLSIVLIDDFNAHDIFENRNRKGLSPKEVAEKADNSFAAEYLTTASNRVKKMRNFSSTISEKEQSQKLEEVMVPASVPLKYGTVGGALVLNGMIFTVAGLTFGDAPTAILGITEGFIGLTVCQDAFNIIKKVNHSKDTQK